jgi:four helix bundle protein
MKRKPARSFKDLILWQKTHRFVINCYHFTKIFPLEERFGLTSQFRRAAVSIAANIVEGWRKKSCKEKLRLLNIAHGSLEECRYYDLLAKDLNYGTRNDLQASIDEISRLLHCYSKAISNSVS